MCKTTVTASAKPNGTDSRKELRRHIGELALLNRASRAFAATLDIDCVLAAILEEQL